MIFQSPQQRASFAEAEQPERCRFFPGLFSGQSCQNVNQSALDMGSGSVSACESLNQGVPAVDSLVAAVNPGSKLR